MSFNKNWTLKEQLNTHVEVTGTLDSSYKYCSSGFLFLKQAIANPASETICVVLPRERAS
jgi:hypothetical protein